MPTLKTLQERLGYTFRDEELLRAALYHSSYANEHRAQHILSNERLEFLGDAVLGFVTAEFLFRNFPDAPEGDLTRTRAALVREESLFEAAQELGLGEYLMLGRGEESGGGRTRPSILADATEAVFAAMYLDGGIEPVRELIHRLRLRGSNIQLAESRRRDYKTELQEFIQRKPHQALHYALIDQSGPDHAKVFTVAVSLNEVEVGVGTGRSKKEAEQAAAAAALTKLTEKE